MAIVASIVASASEKIESVFKRLGIAARDTSEYALCDSKAAKVVTFAITKVDVARERNVTTHPLESRTNISDHIFVEPAIVTLEGFFTRESPTAQQTVESVFKDARSLYSVQTRGQVFVNNLVLHTYTLGSTTDKYDAKSVSLVFREFIQIKSKEGSITVEKAQLKQSADTIKAGNRSAVATSSSAFSNITVPSQG